MFTLLSDINFSRFHHRYDIIDGNKARTFDIDARSGVVTVRNPERMKKNYLLHVRVSDGKYTSVAQVSVTVERSENSGLIFQKSIYEGAILENSTKITTVAVVNVLGSSLNEHIVFSILNPTDMFVIGPTSGAIRTTGIRFDREACDHYELIVEAKSHPPERPKPRVAHVVVNVTILDINDNCPMFVNLPYYAVVSVDAHKGDVITKVRRSIDRGGGGRREREHVCQHPFRDLFAYVAVYGSSNDLSSLSHSHSLTLVVQVHAVDMDSGDNGEVRYELKKGHGELFKVCRKTGEISLKQNLEGHNREYQLTIAAYDGGE